MLGKLIKYDFKAVSKVLLLIHLALCVVGGIIYFVLQVLPSNSFLVPLLLVSFILFCMAVMFSTHAVNIHRFYKNLYTDEGYLTHTLPVKPFFHILSKGIVYFTCIIANILVMVTLFLTVVKGFTSIKVTLQLLHIEYDIAVSQILFFLAGYMVFAFVYFIIQVYFSICVGCTFTSHKIIWSIVIYFVTYLVQQFVTVICFFFSPTMRMLLLEDAANSLFPPVEFFSLMGYVLVALGILSIAMVVSQYYIIHKKLNLE